MEEEKKAAELENTEEALDEEVKEEEKKEERRGLFGAKKRERNERTALTLYALAAFYLLYTSYSMIKDLIVADKVTGTMRIVYIISSIAFILVSVWVLFSSWKVYKRLKAEEEEQARKEAEENGDTWDGEASSQKKGLFGMLTPQEPEKPSIASRAAVYYNPADEEETDAVTAERTEAENPEAKNPEAKNPAAENPDAENPAETGTETEKES